MLTELVFQASDPTRKNGGNPGNPWFFSRCAAPDAASLLADWLDYYFWVLGDHTESEKKIPIEKIFFLFEKFFETKIFGKSSENFWIFKKTWTLEILKIEILKFSKSQNFPKIFRIFFRKIFRREKNFVRDFFFWLDMITQYPEIAI